MDETNLLEEYIVLPIKKIENIIIDNLSQEKFNPLLFQIINLYIDKVESHNPDNAKDKMEKLKIKGYKLFNKRFKYNEYLNYNMITFYCAIKVYEFDIRNYVKDTIENNDIEIQMCYESRKKIIELNIKDIDQLKKEKFRPVILNLFNMETTIHEIRHAIQNKFIYSEPSGTIPKEALDIIYWTISLFFHRGNIEIYHQYHNRYPDEYDADRYSSREFLKDTEIYFTKLNGKFLYEINKRIAKEIYKLNRNKDNTDWESNMDQFLDIVKNNINQLKPKYQKSVKRDMKYLNVFKKELEEDSKDNEMERFMRGEYRKYLEVLPLIMDGTIQTTNLFETVVEYFEKNNNI